MNSQSNSTVNAVYILGWLVFVRLAYPNMSKMVLYHGTKMHNKIRRNLNPNFFQFPNIRCTIFNRKKVSIICYKQGVCQFQANFQWWLMPKNWLNLGFRNLGKVVIAPFPEISLVVLLVYFLDHQINYLTKKKKQPTYTLLYNCTQNQIIDNYMCTPNIRKHITKNSSSIHREMNQKILLH